MKKILFILLFLFAVSTQAQRRSAKVHVVKNIKVTAAERDAYVVPADQIWTTKLDDGTTWSNDGGAGWVIQTSMNTDNQTGSEVPLTGYTKAVLASPVLDTDDLNTALGKVEKKTDEICRTPEDYGAIANDGIDDTAAFTAIVADHIAGNIEKICIPKGRYLVSRLELDNMNVLN